MFTIAPVAPARDDLLLPTELAERWSVTTGHLNNLRWQRRGVPFIKIDGLIAYRYGDVLDFEFSKIVATSDARFPSQAG